MLNRITALENRPPASPAAQPDSRVDQILTRLSAVEHSQQQTSSAITAVAKVQWLDEELIRLQKLQEEYSKITDG